MNEHFAEVSWKRGDANFLDHRYHRNHTWRFDGGLEVAASSSPANVPVPMSDPSAVDPEEALVAATSSCHMLWFLSLAARKGWLVDQYLDRPVGVLGRDDQGVVSFQEITLRPRVGIENRDSTDQLRREMSEIHQKAHRSCFIANSLKCTVRVEMQE